MKESTDIEEYVKRGMDKVKWQIEKNGGDETDVKWTEIGFRQGFNIGMTLDDAVMLARFTEHVNPHLSEEYGCAGISKIMEKYRNGQNKGYKGK